MGNDKDDDDDDVTTYTFLYDAVRSWLQRQLLKCVRVVTHRNSSKVVVIFLQRPVSHVAQSCYSVIGDKPFLWSKAKFDPP